VGFATKPERAAEMIDAALQAGVPASWASADEVYGATTALRAKLRARRLGSVWAVACEQQVSTGAGRVRLDTLPAAALPRTSWQRRSPGNGSKGPRDYDWAWVEINPHQPCNEDDRGLLIHRHQHTGELAYSLCWAPTPIPLTELIRITGAR
jgi:SRSO17 transposase